jgi:hypothetical protein
VTPEQRAAFERLADALLPPVEGLPAPSAVGVGGRWLDRALAARPDLGPVLASLLAHPTGDDALADARRLAVADPGGFAALGLLATGAYYMHPRVRRLIRYPGQVSDPAPDDEADWWLRDGLLDPVAARGPIWRRVP